MPTWRGAGLGAPVMQRQLAWRSRSLAARPCSCRQGHTSSRARRDPGQARWPSPTRSAHVSARAANQGRSWEVGVPVQLPAPRHGDKVACAAWPCAACGIDAWAHQSPARREQAAPQPPWCPPASALGCRPARSRSLQWCHWRVQSGRHGGGERDRPLGAVYTGLPGSLRDCWRAMQAKKRRP